MHRLLLGAVVALAAAYSVPAASQGALRIGLRQDPDLLDPTLGSSYVGRIVYAAMCDKLFDLDTKLNIVPQLATGYRYEDPTHLVIHLRAGVTFHDGEPLTSEAAKYKLTRDLTAKGSMRAGEINAIQTIEVLDPLTIRLVLKAPNSPLLAQLTDRAGIMISPKAVEAEGDQFGLHPVCAGPFAFESRVQQDRILLRRYPGYWNPGDYHFEQVVYLPMTNSSVRLANLQAGSLDLVEFVVPTDVAAVQQDPNLKLAIGDALGYTGINFNMNNGTAANTAIGQNVLVRQAFELSIDRTALIQVVYNGMFTPTAQANPQSSPYYVPSVQPPARDVAKARALLQQAGVTTPVTVVLTTTNESDTQQTAEVIQSMAAEAGFEVKIQAVEFATALDAGERGDFEAFLIGWSGRADIDANLYSFVHSGTPLNNGGYSTKDVDAWLGQAREVADVPARSAIYAKLAVQLEQDLPLIYLFAGKNIVAMSTKVGGFVPVPDGIVRPQGMSVSK